MQIKILSKTRREARICKNWNGKWQIPAHDALHIQTKFQTADAILRQTEVRRPKGKEPDIQVNYAGLS